jgi:hypothetical protein
METHTDTLTRAHKQRHASAHRYTQAHTHTDVQYSDINPLALLYKASGTNKRKYRNVVPLSWLNGKPSE